MKKLPPPVSKRPKRKRIFYRNADKQKALYLLAFLLTLLIVQSMAIGAMGIIIWRSSEASCEQLRQHD